VITSPELHSYAGHKLYKAVKDDMSQEYLVYAAVWVIGEYGDAIVREVPVNEEEDDSPITQVTENDIIDLLESIMKSPFTTVTGREYTLMALMKLSTRFSSQDRIRSIIRSYTNHINSEIQQRAAEFTAMFDFDSIRTSLLEKMPPPEAKSLRKGKK
jgi:AP-1 complex subunit gamma-1